MSIKKIINGQENEYNSLSEYKDDLIARDIAAKVYYAIEYGSAIEDIAVYQDQLTNNQFSYYDDEMRHLLFNVERKANKTTKTQAVINAEKPVKSAFNDKLFIALMWVALIAGFVIVFLGEY